MQIYLVGVSAFIWVHINLSCFHFPKTIFGIDHSCTMVVGPNSLYATNVENIWFEYILHKLKYFEVWDYIAKVPLPLSQKGE